MRRLIINADDFGFTAGVNRAIVEAHSRGVVTSATLMANGPAFAEAAGLAKTVPKLSIGCHVVLEPCLVVEPLVECLVAGARRVERAGADEDDGRLGIAESHLGPAERLRQSGAGAVGPVGLRDRAPVQPLEGVRAEELQVLLALAHAVGNDAE